MDESDREKPGPGEHIGRLLPLIDKLPEVVEFFQGRLLPRDLSIPDNILVFYHTWASRQQYLHTRYTLVIAFSELTYIVDQEVFPLSPGQSLLIRPCQSRYLDPGAGHYDRLFITFELPGEQSYLPESPVSEISSEAWDHLERLLSCYASGSSLLLSLELVYFLSNLSMSSIHFQPRSFSKTVFKANEFISRNLSVPFYIQDIATLLHISESNLRLIYRRETGVSLGHYIVLKRLEAAKHHLLYTDMSLDEVARNCGFGNIYAFSRFFKKNSGVSPIHYRNLYR